METARGEKKRRADSPGNGLKIYQPQWGVVESDSFGASAPASSKEVGRDLCSSFIFPKDRSLYDEAPTVEACENMLGHLTLAVPWAAAVTEKVKDQAAIIRSLKAQMKEWEPKVDPLEGRAKQLEGMLAQSQLQEASLTKEKAELILRNEALLEEKKLLTEGLEVSRRDFRQQKRELKRAKKTLTRSEDRAYAAGYDGAVIAAHQAGLDYKRILSDPADPHQAGRCASCCFLGS